ncbi:hypothetical protein AJ80_05235 [Polytolypa hystricis UAMH7299]|uniref:Myb-like domain-containing protein n=1 Tax=Polytolypa hystricis (strain UAMH7299) TaxID=1447883 RepID=A0A2B7Y5B6_POLH7|nr:hypothetical protein AJ80_05235 [Polytolypa hystricis UAMH7299]
MERPTKRSRLSFSSPSNRHNGEVDVNHARRVNDLKLKSRFEAIFEKYGKDFSSVGDEIDLATGNIVVNNGHIQKMRDEHDPGSQGNGEFDLAEKNSSSSTSRPLEPSGISDLQGGETGGFAPSFTYSSTASEFPPEPRHPAEESLKPTYAPLPKDVRNGTESDGKASRPEIPRLAVVDPAWQAPEIEGLFTNDAEVPIPSFTLPERERSASPPGAGSIWALPRTRRQRQLKTRKPRISNTIRTLRRVHLSCDGSDSDDPLQDEQASASKKASSLGSPQRAKSHSSPTPNGPQVAEKCSEPEFQEPTPPKSVQEQPDVVVDLPPESSESEHELSENLPDVCVNDLSILVPGTPVDDTPEILPASNEDPLASADASERASDETPIPSPSPETEPLNVIDETLSPNEVSIITSMRIVQKRPWKEILRSLPGRSVNQLSYWYYNKCMPLKAGAPQKSSAWTMDEKEQLSAFKYSAQLSWSALESAFQDQSIDEIQYEWVKTCLGEEAWNNWTHSRRGSQQNHTKLLTPKKLETPKPARLLESISPRRSPKPPQPPSPHTETPAPTPAREPQSTNEPSDSDDPLSAAFDAAWAGSGLSSIVVDTPPKNTPSMKRKSLARSTMSPSMTPSKRQRNLASG